jgi:hypothetical protein
VGFDGRVVEPHIEIRTGSMAPFVMSRLSENATCKVNDLSAAIERMAQGPQLADVWDLKRRNRKADVFRFDVCATSHLSWHRSRYGSLLNFFRVLCVGSIGLQRESAKLVPFRRQQRPSIAPRSTTPADIIPLAGKLAWLAGPMTMP